MNITNMQSLAQALIDGNKYKWQTSPASALRHVTSKAGLYHYTVTGVMADVYITQNPKLAYWEDDQDSKFPSKFILKAIGEPWRLDVPQEVLDWYGLSREESNQLWVASARGFSFVQIGEAILKSIKVKK